MGTALRHCQGWERRNSHWELQDNTGILCWVICGETPIYLYYFSNSKAADIVQESLFLLVFEARAQKVVN